MFFKKIQRFTTINYQHLGRGTLQGCPAVLKLVGTDNLTSAYKSSFGQFPVCVPKITPLDSLMMNFLPTIPMEKAFFM